MIIEVCRVPAEAVAVSVVRYHAWNRTMLVKVEGLEDCTTSADQLDFSFAQAVALSSSLKLTNGEGRASVY